MKFISMLHFSSGSKKLQYRCPIQINVTFMKLVSFSLYYAQHAMNHPGEPLDGITLYFGGYMFGRILKRLFGQLLSTPTLYHNTASSESSHFSCQRESVSQQAVPRVITLTFCNLGHASLALHCMFS